MHPKQVAAFVLEKLGCYLGILLVQVNVNIPVRFFVKIFLHSKRFKVVEQGSDEVLVEHKHLD